MTDKQRFLIYAHLSTILAKIKSELNLSLSEALQIMLSKGIIQKIEDLETGYYLESDAYLEDIFSHIKCHTAINTNGNSAV